MKTSPSLELYMIVEAESKVPSDDDPLIIDELESLGVSAGEPHNLAGDLVPLMIVSSACERQWNALVR
jgi:hypothetical protein